jgi:erythromycin esterase-like protein
VSELRIPEYVIDSVTDREERELARRERLYRGGRPPPDVSGRTVILVDDGLATGATMQAAVEALRTQQPAKIVVAVPTASRQTCEALKLQVDEVVCVVTPEPFQAVGHSYQDFSQTTDQEVRDLLSRQRQPEVKEPAPTPIDSSLREAVRKSAHPLTGAATDYDPLLERIGDAHFVLLGEASHGTHEFYRERAVITMRLIEEKGFTAVAAEADWPDAYRVNRYVRRASDDLDAAEALTDFRRFPTWMWRNTDVVAFVEWLRTYNDALPQGAATCGFYGLDLYSLHASMKVVIAYLQKVDPRAAACARDRYACFDRFGENAEVYGMITGTGMAKSCEEEVIAQLVELEHRAMEHARPDERTPDEELFYSVQNARVVKDAEKYYRSMFLEEVSTWNLRDRHMAETLDSLSDQLGRRGGPAKIVVWAHNSHLGDARATQMGERGELNVGQLVREKYGSKAVLVGFTTHHGTVTAASDWGAPADRKNVVRAPPDSFEAILHRAGLARFLLTWRDGDELARGLREPMRLERAIGVIYRPQTERASHYFGARLSDQFDAVLHFDETRAVEPLERTATWEAGEEPETFPFAV